MKKAPVKYSLPESWFQKEKPEQMGGAMGLITECDQLDIWVSIAGAPA